MNPLSIELSETDEGILLPVSAQPGARRDGLVGVHDGRLKVAVTQAAEKGKANTQIIQVMAKALGMRKSQVQLRSGQTSRLKTFIVRGVTLDELRDRLARQLDGQ